MTHPVRTYADPRIEVYAPAGSSPYYRLVAYDTYGNRTVNTTGGRTLRSAQTKAANLAKDLRRRARNRSGDPTKVLVHDEIKLWLDPMNHRTRENNPWSQRHADNMETEWRLRIAPHIGKRTTVAQIDDKHLWVRILNEAQASGLAPASVQKTGQACRSFISWLMDRGLLERNPMRGVTYSMTRADNQGLDPKAVPPKRIPNMDMVYDLAWWMAWPSWSGRPTHGGNRQHDALGPKGRAIQPMLVATTGLRNGEMFALRPSHIDLGDLEIEISDQLIEENSSHRFIGTPKHGSIRTVTFAGFLRDDLAELIAHRQTESGEDDPIIFCAPKGGWEWRHNHGRRFRAARRRADWPEHISWYGLRHLYAVTMLERLPLEIVSKLMGHHSPDFTAKRYLSLRVGWLDQARAASRQMDVLD